MLTAGIDIGSASTEMVILENGEPCRRFIVETGLSSRTAVDRLFSLLEEDGSIKRGDITRTVSTGYGRNAAGVGDRSVTELSCHARGAWAVDNGVKTVIDIGGQDSKVIRVGPDGRSLDFIMNDKCAAGTGRFLEIIAKTLEVEVDELGSLALQAAKGVKISSMCAVFAESEVVSLRAEGHPREKIIRGVADSIASRISGMVRRVGLAQPVMLTGGVAKNSGVVVALREALAVDILVPPEPQFIGALGAAHIAAEEALKT